MLDKRAGRRASGGPAGVLDKRGSCTAVARCCGCANIRPIIASLNNECSWEATFVVRRSFRQPAPMYTFDYMTVFINLVVQSSVRLVYDFAAGDGRVTRRDVGAEVPSERGDVIDLVRSRQQFSILFRLRIQNSHSQMTFRDTKYS